MSFGHVLSRLKIKLCAVTLRRGFSAAVCDSGVRATASQCRGSSAAVVQPRQSSHSDIFGAFFQNDLTSLMAPIYITL